MRRQRESLRERERERERERDKACVWWQCGCVWEMKSKIWGQMWEHMFVWLWITFWCTVCAGYGQRQNWINLTLPVCVVCTFVLYPVIQASLSPALASCKWVSSEAVAQQPGRLDFDSHCQRKTSFIASKFTEHIYIHSYNNHIDTHRHTQIKYCTNSPEELVHFSQ